MSTPIIVTDIDGTLVSERTGQLHPIIVPMLRALQDEVTVLVLTARMKARMMETIQFLDSIDIHAAVRFREGEASPLDHKMRSIDKWQEIFNILMVIDNDVNVLRYVDSLGIPVILP